VIDMNLLPPCKEVFFMSLDQAQLSALIDAAVREAVERTARELTAKHEAETEGLRAKRDELLNKVADRKPWQDSLDAADAVLARSEETLRRAREQSERWSGKGSDAAASTVPEHTILRSEAQDGSKYRAAKAAAEAAGARLHIVDEGRRAPGPAAASRVKFLEDSASRTLYANKEVIREAGGLQRLKENAERDGKRVVVFRSAEDLPSHLKRAHAEIMAAQKPDTLIEGGE
jgi:hypothetical protein